MWAQPPASLPATRRVERLDDFAEGYVKRICGEMTTAQARGAISTAIVVRASNTVGQRNSSEEDALLLEA